MICQNCSEAGSLNQQAQETALSEMWRNQFSAQAKLLHESCQSIDCFCQHRTGAGHIFKGK